MSGQRLTTKALHIKNAPKLCKKNVIMQVEITKNSWITETANYAVMPSFKLHGLKISVLKTKKLWFLWNNHVECVSGGMNAIMCTLNKMHF